MKANNLSICVPYKGCNMKGHCQNYCISKITGLMENSDIEFMRRNYEKVINIAKIANVTSVSITGKGEPTLNKPDTFELISAFKEFSVELQTNGLLLREDKKFIIELQKAGLDVLALSFDTLDQFYKYMYAFSIAHLCNLTTRVTYNITKLTGNAPLSLFIAMCKKFGVDQLSFRRMSTPNYCKENEQTRWIEENKNDELYEKLRNEVSEGRILRTLPYGATLYDIDGIAVTNFDYCIQDNSDGYNTRSLIFMEDGHLYTNWNSLASRIF